MSQQALQFTPQYEGRIAWDAQLEILRACVEHLTSKEVCDVIDVGKSMLSQALSPHNDKLVDPLWIHQIKAMLARRYDETSLKLLEQLCAADLAVTTFALEEPKMTDAEERDAYRSELARMGEEGRAAIDRVKSRAKGKGKRR